MGVKGKDLYFFYCRILERDTNLDQFLVRREFYLSVFQIITLAGVLSCLASPISISVNADYQNEWWKICSLLTSREAGIFYTLNTCMQSLNIYEKYPLFPMESILQKCVVYLNFFQMIHLFIFICEVHFSLPIPSKSFHIQTPNCFFFILANALLTFFF